MKTIIALMVFSVFIFSCNEEHGKTNEQIKHEPKASLPKPPHIQRPTIDLIYEGDNVHLYGDTTIEKEKMAYSALRFEPYIRFKDFKVSRVDNKKYAALNLRSNSIAYSYRTRLREGYSADTTNFAGHYTFVEFGCGSPCRSSFVIDRKTGTVYDSPSAALGYEYRVDSRMLIVNPPDTSGFYDDVFYRRPMIYVFDEQAKTFN
jgi:hypothetical protein